MDQYNSSHILSSYYAPRGHQRMFALGMQLAQQYLSPTDKLIGVIGEAGSGKSALIRGMFPGLELTNDDNGVYVRPLPLLEQDSGFAFFSPHTYHVDIRFENGFTQMSELAEAIAEALKVPCTMADDPQNNVVIGCGRALENMSDLGKFLDDGRKRMLGR